MSYLMLYRTSKVNQNMKESIVKIIYNPSGINDKIGLVRAGKGRLIQVISNLLDNAIKLTEKGIIYI